MITCPNCGSKTKDDSVLYCGECHAFIGTSEPGDVHDIEALVKTIQPILAGKAPMIQGAVLADLVSMFIAGHHPAMREEQLQILVDTARKLIEPNEQAMFANRPRPKDWPS